jgi:alpha-tubulin suppressor-like RCC1 family protein
VAITGDAGEYSYGTFCAVLSTGSVDCWGDNQSGGLGAGLDPNTTPYSAVPVAVSGLSPVSQVVAGMNTTASFCAVETDGTLQCWGNNGWGQLGVGASSSALPYASAPLVVPGLNHVVALEASWGRWAGAYCAVEAAGGVACWGENENGELGAGLDPGSVLLSDAPVPVVGLGDATGLSIEGSGSFCALHVGGTAACWGGDFTAAFNPVFHTVPVALQGLSGATEIKGVVGGGAYCALMSDHSLECWGNNQYGELGTGFSPAEHPSGGPAAVSGP